MQEKGKGVNPTGGKTRKKKMWFFEPEPGLTDAGEKTKGGPEGVIQKKIINGETK